MNRKWLLLLLSSVIFLVLAACGDEDEGSSSDTETSDDEVTIGFYTWINEENGNWEETIAAFEETHPGIKVEMHVLVENMSNEDYLQNLDLIAASGESIDVMMFASPQALSQRVAAGIVEPLNTFIENEGIEVEDVYNMTAIPADEDGFYYALPSKFGLNLVMLNKDHLDEVGLEVPTDWTWDDYKEYAKALTTDDRYGSYLHSWPQFYHVLKLTSKPEVPLIVKPDGSSNADDPMIAESLKLRYELEQVDQSSEPYANIISQQLNYRQQFFSEKASMIPTSSFMLTEWGGFTPEFNIAWAPWPKNNANDPVYSAHGSDSYSVGKNSEHKDEAYTFIRWLTTDGALVQNRAIPAWKEIDFEDVFADLVSITSNPEAVDIESLVHVFEITETPEQYLPAGYITEMYNALNAEAERYLLGEEELEPVLEDIIKAVQDVVDANQ